MAYDDGYYYGQCKIVAVVDNTADNGKTVLITTDDNKTYSGTIANKKCEFLLPPRTLYTVQKVSSGSAEFTTKVEAGYGDCILVHLDTGYVEVKQGDIVGLDYIKAATADDLKNKVPEANAVKELNSNLSVLSNYSINETEIGTWVDGKPIYRRIYTADNVNISSTTLIDSLFTSSDISNLIGIKCCTYVSGEWNENLSISSSTTYYAFARVDTGGVRMVVEHSNISKYAIIIEYTKP